MKTKSNKNLKTKMTNMKLNKTKSYDDLSINMKKSADNAFDELEYSKNEDDSLNEEEIKPKIEIKKKKINSLEKSISMRLYEPFLEKITYLRQLNQSIKNIKNNSSYNCKKNYIIQKKQKEVNTIEKGMLLYNNPLLNSDQLSNSTYNSLLSVLLSSKK